MTASDFCGVLTSDPRLAAHALAPAPVWLWSTDGSRVLWANPTAAVIFNADTPGALAALRFEPDHPGAMQIARLAGMLPPTGAPRLERLRGFGASLGGPLICLCSRITLGNNSAAILVQSTERVGIELALPDRARRLLLDLHQPAAAFSADGELIEATREAHALLGDKRDLVALDAATLARDATSKGRAAGDIGIGRIVLQRLGAGSTFLLLATFADTPEPRPASPAAGEIVSVPAPPTAPDPAANELTPLRHTPLRFVWQMDAASRFTQGIQDFARLLGPATAAALIRPWAEIVEAFALGAAGAQVTRALAAHDTWSGIVLDWPTDEGDARLPIEMSGLPVFDRDRQFAGFRGFGICRDRVRLTAIEARRAQSSPRPSPRPNPAPSEEPKVVPFPTVPSPPRPEPPPEPPPAAAESADPVPMLSPGEHSAFQELARELSERLKRAPGEPGRKPPPPEPPSEPFLAPAPAEPPRIARTGDAARPFLDRLPAGILVYRLNNLLYANRSFLAWTGYESLGALADAGGFDRLFTGSEDDSLPKDTGTGTPNNPKPLTITTADGRQRTIQGRLFSTAWNDQSALVLMIDTEAGADDQRARAAEASLRRLQAENRNLKSILDTATDGVIVLDRAGRILSANRSAEALFGYGAAALTELSLGDLLAPESRRGMLDHLQQHAKATGAGMLDAGREAIGRVRQGGLVPLYITLGRIDDGEKLCAVIRDLTTFKRSEEELINARQEAEKASTAKSEFLAKISHEIRTPLNAIIGFSEVMIDERFGPLGNDRYGQYLKDIHASGSHLLSLLNDLLDLSKIEAGKLDLTFVSVNLNDLVAQCVAIMQQEANRERVIIRTSLPTSLPPIVADARSVRQIALNVLSNSIKFTGAGGQVIVSTAIGDDNEVVLRVRDTGTGMSEKELQTALEPFRQIATSSRWGGTGLGLPITKALAEANHARFRITSRVDDGTLVEVTFPATRVLAQ
ncbi:MAG TPA: histidine kinase dimerization/phospho-acceptor domain-containing protein [Pseudolabrys sp.]|nr:histidine kinase dimerization/phospho-acceptor domain-containing protein [Pseudolabrys sp.]